MSKFACMELRELLEAFDRYGESLGREERNSLKTIYQGCRATMRVSDSMVMALERVMYDCCHHFGGIGPEGLGPQPCDECDQAKELVASIKEWQSKHGK